MTFRSYLWGMKISMIASFAAWILVIWQIDPEKSRTLGQLLFFAVTFLFFSGIFILFFTWMRKTAGGDDEIELNNLRTSFRQGILMAFLAVLLLFLQRYRILTWWDGALTVAGIFLIELYFLTKR